MAGKVVRDCGDALAEILRLATRHPLDRELVMPAVELKEMTRPRR